MKNNRMSRFSWILIGVGVIIGVLISAGLDLTQVSNALPVAENQERQMAPATKTENAGIAALNQLSSAFADVAERVNPSVVTIFTETKVKTRGIANSPFHDFFGDEFFRQFFGAPNVPEREYTQQGLGSGVIVSEDGIIVTNNHVVEGADDIRVRLMDGSEYEAEIKGRDKRTDLAVIKIDAKKLPAIKFGDSDKERVGAWVLAIGSPLSPELAHTVTSGIISAKGRSGVGLSNSVQDFIQTDAAINPGNSGGALVNLKGELIGINTAIATRNGGFMGIGFAIPSNLVKKVMTDILEKGRVVRGWLGVVIQNVDQQLAKALGMEKPEGVVVSKVEEGSPAEKAGLQPGDVIIRFNDRRVKNTINLSSWVSTAGVDAKITLTILRDGKEKKLNVALGEMPENLAAAESRVEASEKIGIKVANITSDLVKQFDLKVKKDAVVVTEVANGSVAAQAGLRPGDVILKINRKPVKSVADFQNILDKIKENESILFYIQRDDTNIFIAFTMPEK
ncbi:MAG: DegQ family serine endoprotease [Calditrichia bacterium]